MALCMQGVRRARRLHLRPPAPGRHWRDSPRKCRRLAPLRNFRAASTGRPQTGHWGSRRRRSPRSSSPPTRLRQRGGAAVGCECAGGGWPAVRARLQLLGAGSASAARTLREVAGGLAGHQGRRRVKAVLGRDGKVPEVDLVVPQPCGPLAHRVAGGVGEHKATLHGLRQAGGRASVGGAGGEFAGGGHRWAVAALRPLCHTQPHTISHHVRCSRRCWAPASV